MNYVMKYTSTLIIYRSKRDTNGNTYAGAKVIDHKEGKEGSYLLSQKSTSSILGELGLDREKTVIVEVNNVTKRTIRQLSN